MVSQLTTQLGNAKEIPGLIAVRVHFDTIQGADNRLCISGSYDDKQAAEEAQERVKTELSRLKEFIVGEVAVREGEIVWSCFCLVNRALWRFVHHRFPETRWISSRLITFQPSVQANASRR